MRIGLVTCVQLPEPDMDEVPLLAALRDAGHDAEVVAWDGPAGAPGSLAGFDAVCLRATWNYARAVDRFVGWVEAASRSTRVLNPAGVVRWNVQKTYLEELAARGVAVVPTVFVERGASADIAAVMAVRGWEAVVVKPTVGAGSMLAKRFGEREAAEAQRFLDEHACDRGMMVQRYMPSVERGASGELAIVTIGGEVSHGVRKKPRFAAEDEAVEGWTPTAEERGFAREVLRAAGEVLAGEELLYARVDVMRSDDGGLMLSELELVEPSLYFALGEGSAARFVRVLEGMVGGGR